jgi:hypothetical protein
MSAPTEPQAPESLPKYLAEGLPKQDRETLAEISEYVEALINHKTLLAEPSSEPAELPEDSEGDQEGLTGSIHYEFRTCGDESCQCMTGGTKHGPYRYRVYREGETIKKEYLGKANT